MHVRQSRPDSGLQGKVPTCVKIWPSARTRLAFPCCCIGLTPGQVSRNTCVTRIFSTCAQRVFTTRVHNTCVQRMCTPCANNACAQHVCETRVYTTCVQHVCPRRVTTRVHNACVQRVCATRVCNACVQHVCATRVDKTCVQHECTTRSSTLQVEEADRFSCRYRGLGVARAGQLMDCPVFYSSFIG